MVSFYGFDLEYIVELVQFRQSKMLVVDEGRQYESAIDRFGEVQTTQKLLCLISESAHTRAVHHKTIVAIDLLVIVTDR